MFFNGLQVAGGAALKAEILDRFTGALQQPGLEGRIRPGARNDLGTAHWADVIGVGLQRFRRHKAAFDGKAFQRLDAQRRIRRQVAVQVSVEVCGLVGVKSCHEIPLLRTNDDLNLVAVKFAVVPAKFDNLLAHGPEVICDIDKDRGHAGGTPFSKYRPAWWIV